MPGSSSERAEQLKSFVREEIEKYSRGEILTVPTWQKVADLFGYRFNSTPRAVIQKAGLLDNWRIIQINAGRIAGEGATEKNRSVVLTPSGELAWMIGALSCGGYVNPDHKGISADSVDEEFLKTFKFVGERLFKVNGRTRFTRDITGEDRLKGVIFYKQDIARQIGDLRRPIWPDTIREQHAWILTKSTYSWPFLAGIFDRVGNASEPTSNDYNVRFRASDLNCANFLADLCVRLGVERPKPDFKKRNGDSISGIYVSNVKDVQTIAQNIHSTIPEKERRLELYRNLKFKSRRLPLSISREPSPENLISEWGNLRVSLGHDPNSSEITKLKIQDRTPYSVYSYCRVFGDPADNFSFTSARANLERLYLNSDL